MQIHFAVGCKIFNDNITLSRSTLTLLLSTLQLLLSQCKLLVYYIISTCLINRILYENQIDYEKSIYVFCTGKRAGNTEMIINAHGYSQY